MTINLIAPKNKNNWPEIWKKCYNIWTTSPFTIKMWDDEEIDKLLFNDDSQFFNILKKCPKIYKYDYIRPLIISSPGDQAYFDMDVEIKRNFFPLLKSKTLYVLGGFSCTGIESAIMVKKEGFDIRFLYLLKHFLQDRISNNSIIPNSLDTTLIKTGPFAFSSFYSKWMSIESTRIKEQQNKIQILPSEMFGSSPHDLSYTIHHHTNVWH